MSIYLIVTDVPNIMKRVQGIKDSRVQVTRSAVFQPVRRNHQRSMLQNYKDLKVRQKSYELCLEIYRIAATFLKEERYGLTSHPGILDPSSPTKTEKHKQRSDHFSFNKYFANAGSSTRAPTMFQRNMKVNKNPMSAWNLMGENAQVATPKDRVMPVKVTALPVVFNAR